MNGSGIKGKVALVTGGAQGIGAAVAKALAEQGALVAVVDRNEGGVKQVARELIGSGYCAKAYAADVSDANAVEAAVDAIEREMGPIELLANVAGVLRMGPIDAYSDEDWAATFAVNVNGVFHVSRAVVRKMASRNAGAIVTVSSNAASVPRTNMAAYAASKAASTMFTHCLGLEHAKHNIRCNVVSPGSTDTDMQRLLWHDESGPAAVIAGSQQDYRIGIPLQRIADPADIADAVVFLLSDRAKHITMHDMRVDGGATLGA
ncbi:2,3-dihydro-2,3-dihydroxybenzoate dehydrogenase [Paenibacillus phyllosphaerae]|uniref:2,3-dihydro-2,3-dihydroxybenzoate dehydrogenase n=1 Tax=Paenibacillus phyllosphaerae TaxID=274593 RepID=A0A7W5FL51_9BACL|nr:2,3-dihydro-2,3-dihydroxybenzoate dehydrogenase [Paenibacillus phyllosphaerae]MBB3108627.1 2,3-dihydro-2,3-dihydroxybenzoate dehydrogenase [Paenibacillus phyllosphaerae]